jgi:hypothetical protein
MDKDKDEKSLKIDKKNWLIWAIIVVLLIVWWEIAFLIALSML